MCGIFGYIAREDIDFKSALRGLWAVEGSESFEPHKLAVGMAGAGMLIYWGEKWLLRQARAIGSPVVNIAVRLEEDYGEAAKLFSNIYMGHVRSALEEWQDTLKYFEYLQPYVVSCEPGVEVISTHAGELSNQDSLRAELGPEHELLTEKKGRLYGPEVVAHYFEMLVSSHGVEKALDMLYDRAEGNSTAAFMVLSSEICVALMHKGVTEGFVLWRDGAGGIAYASRYEPVMKRIGDLLSSLGFRKEVEVAPGEEGEYKEVVKIPRELFKRGTPRGVEFLGY